MAKKFRSASEICKYDCSFEEIVLKELGGNLKENNKRDSRRYSIRNEEIMKNLSELQEDEVLKGKKSAPPPLNRNDNTTLLRMKAETAAEMYLGLEDASKFLRFLDFYVELIQQMKPNSSFTDENIVKSFNLFDGNVKKSAEFLVVAEELEELGFENEKVVSALMLFSNDREAALQFLMKD